MAGVLELLGKLTLATYDGFSKEENTYAYYTEGHKDGTAKVKITHPGVALDLRCAAHSIHNTRKFREQAVAGILDDAAVVLGDLRINQFPQMCPQAFVRALLIGTHQPGIARNIGGKDRGETASKRVQFRMSVDKGGGSSPRSGSAEHGTAPLFGTGSEAGLTSTTGRVERDLETEPDRKKRDKDGDVTDTGEAATTGSGRMVILAGQLDGRE
jgi:hypothetical protein